MIHAELFKYTSHVVCNLFSNGSTQRKMCVCAYAYICVCMSRKRKMCMCAHAGVHVYMSTKIKTEKEQTYLANFQVENKDDVYHAMLISFYV